MDLQQKQNPLRFGHCSILKLFETWWIVDVGVATNNRE